MLRITHDFLYHPPYIPRLHLENWAWELLRHLKKLDIADLTEYETLISTINRAALVFTYLGERDTAKQICKAELSWIEKQTSKIGTVESATLSRLAIDPWINYGRLLGIEGRTKDALSHFAIIYLLNAGEDVLLGPCCITPNIWAKIEAIDLRIKDTLLSIYVIESLKAYFRSGDFGSALKFTQNLRGIRCPVLLCMVKEGNLIAASHLGLHDQVILATNKTLDIDNFYYDAVLMIYRLSSYLSMNERSILKAAQGLALLVSQDIFNFVPQTLMLRFIQKLGNLLETINEQRLALSMYVKGLELARYIDDQPYEFFFLKSLINSGVTSHKQYAEWNNSYCQLITTCEYISIRRSEGLPPVLSETKSVYQDLLKLIEEVLLT